MGEVPLDAMAATASCMAASFGRGRLGMAKAHGTPSRGMEKRGTVNVAMLAVDAYPVETGACKGAGNVPTG